LLRRDRSDGVIAGYYTLACASIPTRELPAELARRLPRYPTLPAVRIGRLAVHLLFRGQGFGRLLLWDAATRVMRADQANFTLLVDSKDERCRTLPSLRLREDKGPFGFP
jgi:hypothetical protein